MRFWKRLQLLFGFSDRPRTGTKPEATPKNGVRLNAASQGELSNALRALEPGQKGWISYADAARLFSPSAEHRAEWDEARIRRVTEFAADIAPFKPGTERG